MLRKKLKLDDDNSEVDTESSINNHRHCNQALTTIITFEKLFWEKIWNIEQELAKKLLEIDFKTSDKKISAIYNPIDYAADLHCNFLKKYLKKAPKVLFLGMNPGLNGMSQSAVPFGNVSIVKNWMKLSGIVNRPINEIPSKPIRGLECTVEEPSGKRFWGLIQELCGDPESFFQNCWVQNYCPLAFLSATGRNITPCEIKGSAKTELNIICLKYLKEAIEVLDPKIIISIGSFTNDRVKELKKKKLLSSSIECKLLAHPSPRAINNQNWVEKANQWFIENDIVKYFRH